MDKIEIKIAGFGGQGVILSAMIIGKAASIFDKKNATLIQSFGPEARGSACSAQVIVSSGSILYPYVTVPDILVVMSQEAYNKFEPELSPKGILIYEEDMVKINPQKRGDIKTFSIPATRLAEEMGRRLVLNIVMVGFFTVVTDIISHEAMKKAVTDSVPKGTEALNLGAFQKGYDYAVEYFKNGKDYSGVAFTIS